MVVVTVDQAYVKTLVVPKPVEIEEVVVRRVVLEVMVVSGEDGCTMIMVSLTVSVTKMLLTILVSSLAQAFIVEEIVWRNCSIMVFWVRTSM